MRKAQCWGHSRQLLTPRAALGAGRVPLGWSEGAVAELPTLWPPPGAGQPWPTPAHGVTAGQEAVGGPCPLDTWEGRP